MMSSMVSCTQIMNANFYCGLHFSFSLNKGAQKNTAGRGKVLVFHSVDAGDLVCANFAPKRSLFSFSHVGCRSSVSSTYACFTRLKTLLSAVMRLVFRAFVTATWLLLGATDTSYHN